MVVPDDNNYGDLHRGLLQLLMGRGAVDETSFLATFQAMNTKFLPEQPMEVDKVIQEINGKISAFDQTITKYEYGLTNEVFYVFHSTSGTSSSKLQNIYKEDEIEYFKILLRNITQDEELTITPLQALNLCTGGKVKKQQAEKLLESWIRGNYFKKHENKIHLGPKMLCEFKELLQSLELNYLKSCLLCENIAVWGDRCQNCATIFHQSCIRKYISRTKKCPSCKQKWRDVDQNQADDSS